MKRIAVTGSIATDHLMTFPARFTDQIVGDKLSRLSLSFLADTLDVRRGGVAANIAFGLGCLGMSPVLVGAVGRDFADYDAWLRQHGVDTSAVAVSATRHTARFLCTTDVDQNQIATFYSGAMCEAKNIVLGTVAADLVLISPNDPDAMIAHTTECRRRGYDFAADPSQQLARMEREQVRLLVTGARYLFTNEYEHALLLEKTGWTDPEVLGRTQAWITTMGAAGVLVERADGPHLRVDAVRDVPVVDPTGAGDGFRAGFLYGHAGGLTLERSAQLGCLVAAEVLASPGSQEYKLDRSVIAEAAARNYGASAAADVEAVLRTRS
jgi:adenosine kinase